MKKFVVCKSSKKSFRTADLVEGDEHAIIYCKDLKTVFEAWSDLTPEVKAVTINVYTEDPSFTVDPFFLNLPVNTNIKEISFNCYTHDFWLRFILDTCPNLETLFFFKLTKEKIKYAAENFEFLTHIFCDYIEEDTADFYKELKTMDKGINKRIKIN